MAIRSGRTVSKAANCNEIITWKEKTNGKKRGEKKPFGDTQGRPNILSSSGHDIGITNISAYSDGVVGYETPNIDRIAKEGIDFHRLLRRESLHCGPFGVPHRPARHPHRPTKVGIPGAPMGMSQLDPSIGGLLKSLGYNRPVRQEPRWRPQRDLPTVNGFDEFFGNLYHLNAEEEPELPDYPKDPAFKCPVGAPRGVLDCKASDTDDPTQDPRFGKIGKQTIEDTGPLTKKRMEPSTTRPPPRPSTT